MALILLKVGGFFLVNNMGIKAADVMDQEMEYVYSDGKFWHFMLTDGSYEQYSADTKGNHNFE